MAKKNTKKSTKSADKKAKIKKEVEKNKGYVKLQAPKVRHIAPEPYSLCRVGAEIYTTDEDNFEPYVSSFNQDTGEEKKEEEEEEENVGYDLHRGEIIGTHYVNNITSMNFESDYKEMTSAGNIKLDDVDLSKSYKGVRIQLLSEWESPNSNLKWANLNQGVLGFITEQTFSENNVDIKVNGMTALMEEKVNFDFKQMKRSEILREIILTAGLKPMINVTGLDDDVTDFTSSSKDEKSSSDSSGSAESSGSASIDEAAKKAIEGKTDDLAKAKAIDSAFKSHVYYKYYWNCHFSDIEKAWKDAHLNCADGANVLCAMFRAGGVNAVIVHTTGHYIVKVKAGGKTYYTDNAASTGSHTSRPFGEVWRGITNGSEVGTKISG